MFDFLRRRAGGKQNSGHTADLPVLSPVEGRIVPLDDVPDPVFSKGLVGSGFAVDPTENVFRSPISGTVVTLPDSLHAVGIRSDSGAEILVHVGIDSVSLKGEGFRALCSLGQSLGAGDPMLEVDLGLLTSRLPSTLTPVVVTTQDGFSVSAPDVEATTGTPVLTVTPS